MKTRSYFFQILSIISLLSISCSDNQNSLSGAGATFPAPFYNEAFRDFETTHKIKIDYGGVGSGAGIRSLKDKTVDFGATDVFLSDAEITDMGADIIHVPTVLGAVVLAYNIEGVADLKLDAKTITDIYLGEITNWNDAKIKALNPDIEFPDLEIVPVYRSDGSGTTAVFSEYMSVANPVWKEKLGAGKSIKFEKGIAAKGNPGVAANIKETKGTIGYVGSEYSFAVGMNAAKIKNSSGNFIEADLNSITQAANFDIASDTRQVISNSDNPEAYPIATITWLVVYKEQAYNNRTVELARNLKSLLEFVIAEQAQGKAPITHYAPLPQKVVEKAKNNISQITFKGEAI